MIERDADGFAVRLYLGPYRHHDSNRFCPPAACVSPNELCARCHVPRLTPELRAKNLAMVRAGKRDASTPDNPMTRAEAKRRGWTEEHKS